MNKNIEIGYFTIYCKNCNTIKHDIDNDKSIIYNNKYYCCLDCFNNTINGSKTEELLSEIKELKEEIEDLNYQIDELSYPSKEQLIENLEYIKEKVNSVYGLYDENDDYKVLYEKVDDVISDLVEYYNDEVSI